MDLQHSSRSHKLASAENKPGSMRKALYLAALDAISVAEWSFRAGTSNACNRSIMGAPFIGLAETAFLQLGSKKRKSAAFAIAALMAGMVPTIVHADILSSKRGFADVSANYNDLQASGASWYYTWGTGPANPGNFNANFYPMFWNAPSQSTINQVVATNPLYVLGFNEPDNPTQSNMTVAQAISSWKMISASFANTSTQLVSPAVEDTSTGHQWIENFMSQAKADNLKVNAVAFHWYDDSNPLTPPQS